MTCLLCAAGGMEKFSISSLPCSGKYVGRGDYEGRIRGGTKSIKLRKTLTLSSLKSIKTHLGYCLVLFIQKEHLVITPQHLMFSLFKCALAK